MILITIWLAFTGLCLGSYVNAAVWRIHEQSIEGAKKKPNKQYLRRLSILQGRSMCSTCHHVLAPKDLVPVFSWISLRGKCRYCSARIPDTPFSEVATSLLFVLSYLCWPSPFSSVQIIIFVLWLTILVGLMILVVYDFRWLLLPNRVVYPLAGIACVQAVFVIQTSPHKLSAMLNLFLGFLIGGGLFYVLFQISQGRWIGGGDVKLGWLLGLIMATPARSLLLIFVASVGGSMIAVPLLTTGRLKRTSVIPFGPFLIFGAIIVQLFGVNILNWYEHILIMTN